jgi:hypothetical protein
VGAGGGGALVASACVGIAGPLELASGAGSEVAGACACTWLAKSHPAAAAQKAAQPAFPGLVHNRRLPSFMPSR